MRDASVVANTRASVKKEDKISRYQDENSPTEEGNREEDLLSFRQNFREKVPDRHRKRKTEHKGDRPCGDMQPKGRRRHIGVRSEGANRHVGEKVAHAHEAEPEEEHRPGTVRSLTGFAKEQTAREIGDAIAKENSRNRDQGGGGVAADSEEWSVVHVLVDIRLQEKVGHIPSAIVESERIGLGMEQP